MRTTSTLDPPTNRGRGRNAEKLDATSRSNPASFIPIYPVTLQRLTAEREEQAELELTAQRTIFNLSTPLEAWEWHALWSKVGTYLGSQGDAEGADGDAQGRQRRKTWSKATEGECQADSPVHAFLFEITPDMASAHLRTSNEFAQWFDDDITMFIGDVCPGCDVDIDMFYEDHSPASSDYEEGPYWQY
ncbi:hypothetical protein A1Q2_01650 [Trichosporon asahii var. asahii CBS 8904]|uniref:Uncharacterized protein n=1 Tax=Trichosporon asahii var. asahii (strain CBS 8904) TaxID=1220162 RepID=K1VTU1_TRIAC|nr:hypothetical protein A1Q2_01650 [Trichosporon asahii var. asahii CBS 8904]